MFFRYYDFTFFSFPNIPKYFHSQIFSFPNVILTFPITTNISPEQIFDRTSLNLMKSTFSHRQYVLLSHLKIFPNIHWQFWSLLTTVQHHQWKCLFSFPNVLSTLPHFSQQSPRSSSAAKNLNFLIPSSLQPNPVNKTSKFPFHNMLTISFLFIPTYTNRLQTIIILLLDFCNNLHYGPLCLQFLFWFILHTIPD